MTKRILLIIVASVAVSVSVAAYYRSATAETDAGYTTALVTRGAVIDAVEVGSQVSGTIKALTADYNSQVRKGEVVARLEPSLFQTQVDQAQASLVRLQADVDRARVTLDDATVKLKRAKELWAAQLIPRTDLETADATAQGAEASLKSAQAQVSQARAVLNQNQVNLGHTIIRAPIDGIVISRSVAVGQTVAASMSAPTLFVIAEDLRKMRVSASVDESDIGRIEVGQHVAFTVNAYPGRTFGGTVSQVRLEPKVESNVVSYTTVIDVPNDEMLLKPGMTADVSIEIARSDDTLRVPSSALRFRPATAAHQETQAARAETRTIPAGRTQAQTGSETARIARVRDEGVSGVQGTGGERRGARVWVLRDGQPTAIAVQPGVSDGATTGVVSRELVEGEQIITGAAQPAAAAVQTSASPFMPQRPGRNGAAGAGAGASGGQRPGGG